MKKVLLYITFLLCSLSLYAQDFTLDQCVQMARQYNRTLQNAALDIQAASEQKKEAFANYFPKISANVSAFYMFDKMIKQDGTIPNEIAYILPALKDYAGTPYSIREFNSMYTATVSAIEPIYAGRQVHTGNKLADLQEDVMALQRNLKEDDIEQKVTEHFWKIAQIKYNLRSIDAADKYLESFMETTQLYIKAGIKTHNDELKVKLRQQELESNRIKLNNAQHVLLLLLAQEIGATDSVQMFDIVVPESVMPISPDEEPMLKNSVLEGQGTAGMQYQLALKNVEAQQLQVKMERAKMLPTVAAGVMGYHVGLGGLSDNVKSMVNPNMTNALAVGVVSIPITDWIGGSHAIKRQKIKAQQAKNEADDACEKLIVDLESSWSNVQEAYEQIKVRQTGVQQAAENLRLSANQYKSGTETLTDLLDAELLNRQTEDAFSSALADYQIRLADYQRKIK